MRLSGTCACPWCALNAADGSPFILVLIGAREGRTRGTPGRFPVRAGVRQTRERSPLGPILLSPRPAIGGATLSSPHPALRIGTQE